MYYVVKNVDGSILQEGSFSNLITDAGRSATANKLCGATAVPDFTRLAIGVSATAPSVGDTTLGSEITTGGGERAVATVSITTTDSPDDTFQLDYEWTFSDTFAVEEVGVFNGASGGTLFARALFPAGTINVSTGMKLHVYWRCDID